LVKFIRADNNLFQALKSHDWVKMARIYNGAAYKEMAKEWGRVPCDISLRKAYEKYSMA
jgi:hypothetical protein